VTPVRLFAVAAFDGHAAPSVSGAGKMVTFRDLAALTADTPSARPSVAPGDLDAHRAAVAAAFAHHPVLPAPPGTVFRTGDSLMRWLELHYVTLRDALSFVEGRAEARVHVARRASEAPGRQTEELAVDIDVVAGDAFRVLRRHAVASVALRSTGNESAPDNAAASAAFLVERDRWRTFADVVAEEARRDPGLLFRLTGPWPPYDFVSMEFGG
jgi:hypothetical protein